MPIYDRQCSDCEELFEVTCRIAEKDNTHECPYCGSTAGEWRPTSCMTTIRPDRLMTAKKDNGFKEVLDKIKERNKRTNLASGRNTGTTAMG
jgi:putative FmdB family regulatory protein